MRKAQQSQNLPRQRSQSFMKDTITGHLGLGLLSVKGRDPRPGQEGT